MISLASSGAFFGRIGIPLLAIDTSYNDGVKKPATCRETMIAMNMGMKMLIDAVVSIMITASEYVMRQYADSIAPTANKTGTTEALYDFSAASGYSKILWFNSS